MALLTPFETIQQLIIFLEFNPSEDQIVSFLSKHLDPYGEISGVGWVTINSQGIFEYPHVAGLKIQTDTDVKLDITADNPVVESLRLGRLMKWDMQIMYAKYSDAIHKKDFEFFATGLSLPLSKKCLVAVSLHNRRELYEEYESYFECIRLVLAQWLARNEFEITSIARRDMKLGKELTKRQGSILEKMKEGMTNSRIAIELGYSESLIRQETIIIYRKLGIAGRIELRKRTESEV